MATRASAESHPALDGLPPDSFLRLRLYVAVVMLAALPWVVGVSALGLASASFAYIVVLCSWELFSSLAYWLFHRRLPTPNRSWFRAALVMDAIVLTAIINFLGNEYAPYGVAVYSFAVVYAAPGVSIRECLLSLSICVAAYVGLIALRAAGIVSTPEGPLRAAPEQQAIINLLFMTAFWVATAATAVFLASTIRRANASRLAAQDELERLNADLEQRVAERTTALNAVNNELAVANRSLEEYARALEKHQDRFREFAFLINHDLKQPVTGILNTAELLQQRQDVSLSAEGRIDVEQIKGEAGRALEMIDGLLKLFQVIAAREPRSLVDLQTLFGRLEDEVRRELAQKRARLTIGPLPSVWGHAQKLAHVFSNLLSNAVKYIPAGRGEIEVSATTAEGSVVVCVRDNGIGIPAAYRDHVFKLFGRVPVEEQKVDGKAIPGAGVGLAMVRRVVEAHGGVVWVDSHPGEGSRLYVRLPAGTAEGESQPSAVLIVDDDATFLRNARAVLRRINPDVEVHTAETGAAGLAFIKRQPPFAGVARLQFVLLDFQLPDMNADAVLEEIRSCADTKDIPVLVASQSDHDERHAAALAAGADAFFVKPPTVHQLHDAVETFWKEHVDAGEHPGRRRQPS